MLPELCQTEETSVEYRHAYGGNQFLAYKAKREVDARLNVY